MRTAAVEEKKCSWHLLVGGSLFGLFPIPKGPVDIVPEEAVNSLGDGLKIARETGSLGSTVVQPAKTFMLPSDPVLAGGSTGT